LPLWDTRLKHSYRRPACPPLGFMSRTAGRTSGPLDKFDRQPRAEAQSLNRPCQIHPSFHEVARAWSTPPRLHLPFGGCKAWGLCRLHAGQNLPIGYLANCTGRAWNSWASKPTWHHSRVHDTRARIGGNKCDNAEKHAPKLDPLPSPKAPSALFGACEYEFSKMWRP
jgi:hypothetical protein